MQPESNLVKQYARPTEDVAMKNYS